MPQNTTSPPHLSTAQHTWGDWIEPWFLSYGLLGVVIAGLLPIVLPLLVSQQGTAAQVGMVIASFNASGLTAPLWGWLADRYRLHRWLLLGGLLVSACASVLLLWTQTIALWMLVGFVLNLGATAANTIANLFIVERYPEHEWEPRLGWLQTTYGAGQVLGLLCAALIGQLHLRLGLLLGAAACALALLPAWRSARTPAVSLPQRPVLPYGPRHTDGVSHSPQQLFHHIRSTTLQAMPALLQSYFSLWLASWFVATAGAGTFFALYPVLMRQIYGLPPIIASTGFALAAGGGLLLYSPAGSWSQRYQSLHIAQLGLGFRMLAFLGLWVLGIQHAMPVLALPLFGVIVLSWSLISVSSTAFTAEHAPVNEGAALGLFNASTALANLVGAALAGWVASRFGYQAIALLAWSGVTLGLLGTCIQRGSPAEPLAGATP